MTSRVATPTARDIEILTAAMGSVEGSAALVGGMAPDLANAGSRAHLEALAASLHEEAQQLRSMALAEWQAAQENDDRETGESEDASTDFLFAVYDQRQVQDRGADAIKWYNPHTNVGDTSGNSRRTKKRGICFHHTAVAGGFGTHSSRRDFWSKQAGSGLWTPSVPQPNGESVSTVWPVEPSGAPWEGLTESERVEAWVRAMALADRYRGFKPSPSNTGVPYHVVSAANSVLYLNLPFDWVTWHGNGANTHYLGFGWDAKSSVDTFDRGDMRRDVLYTIEVGRDEGHFADGVEFTCHCAWTNKPSDPGAAFIAFLVDLAGEVGAKIDLDFKASSSARSMGEVLAAA